MSHSEFDLSIRPHIEHSDASLRVYPTAFVTSNYSEYRTHPSPLLELHFPLKNEAERNTYQSIVFQELIDQQRKFGRYSPKGFAHAVLTYAKVADPDTVLIPGHDIYGLDHVVRSFLQSGRRKLWFGTAIHEDFIDAYAPSHLRQEAEFWGKEGVNNLEDFYRLLPKIMAYYAQHPELLIKAFPQDGNERNLDQHIGRALTIPNGVTFQVKYDLDLNNRDEITNSSRLTNIQILKKLDTHNQVIVKSSQSNHTLAILSALTSERGIKYFKRFQKTAEGMLPTKPNLLCPEFILENEKFGFFTDFNWGNEPSQSPNHLVDIYALLKAAAHAPITYTSELNEVINKKVANDTQDDKLKAINEKAQLLETIKTVRYPPPILQHTLSHLND